ncbi:MAG TPA: hypothetical protein VI278_12290 [Nitrososphaeraceae archaeon]
MKLDLLTNATLVDDAIRFVSSNVSKDKETAKENEEEEEDKTINKIF